MCGGDDVRKIFFALVILFSVCNNVFAETRLRVGYVPSVGFLEEDRIGHIRGYGYEYMEFLSRYGNWKFEYVPSMTWRECNEKLQAGVIDILPAMPGDYRSLENVKRTDHVVGRYAMGLITQDGKIRSHMLIGTTPTSPPMPGFPKVAQTEGFTYELINFPLFYDMEEAFKRRELDGYIAPILQPNKTKNVAAVFDRQSYRILIRPDRKDLLNAMNIAMDAMLMDQPNIRDRLNEKYLRAGGTSLILTRQEKDYLARKKKLTTAILKHDRPYAYYDDNGELHGVLVNMIKQISKDLDIDIEILKTETPKEVDNLIRQGRIDFVADAVCDFSWAETLNMAPTQSYLNLEYISVKKPETVLNNDSKVACAPDLLYTKNFIFPIYSEDQRVYCMTLEECFEAVSDGRADIVFAPRSEVPYIIEDTNTYNLEVSPESVFTDSLSLGVALNADPRLWRILNKEVNHLDMSKIRSSVSGEMVETVTHVSLQWQLYHHPLRVIGVMIIIIAIISAGVFYRMYLRKKHLKEMQYMAYTDKRYQLPNISLLEEELPKIFKKYKDEEENLYAVSFIIDHEMNKKFLPANTLRSHQIKNMAQYLNDLPEFILTAVNSENDGLVSLCKNKNISDVARLAREVVRKVGFMETKDSRIWIYIKVGICQADEKDLIDCIESSQIACRRTNKDVAIFDSQLTEELEFGKLVEEKMADALKNSEFQAWYQPEYDIKTHIQTGAEAFIRWKSEELGFLRPEKFLAVFERNGFITAMDHFILEEVCKLQKNSLDKGKKIIPIAVNQSGLHFSEENYIEKMKLLSVKYKLPPGSIKLEFGEKNFAGIIKVEQETRIVNILQSLQKLGFKISVDNFGSGDSSYKILNHLSVDELKIDRTLLYSAMNSKRMRNILKNIIQLGHALGTDVICEGIETKEQENFLMKLGCNLGQGFMNSDLISSDEFSS